MGKLREFALGKIAEMICGDAPYTMFPYRSSCLLTQFFQNLDMEYEHDGSTRKKWVKVVLIELNDEPGVSEELPSSGILRVLESLMSPDCFSGVESADIDKALVELHQILRGDGFSMSLNEYTGKPEFVTRDGNYISTAVREVEVKKRITFTPLVFEAKHDLVVDKTLVSVMMPFQKEFDPVYKAINEVCQETGMHAKRADDIWKNSVIVQDIYDLIITSNIVVVDYTSKNSNVLYETGIAHTLGKIVVPITQSIDDIPFDLGHHRAFKYLPNSEGMLELRKVLKERFLTILKSQ